MAQKKTSIRSSIRNSLDRLQLRETITSLQKHKRYTDLVVFMRRKPMTSFILGLLILLGVIALGNIISGFSKPEETQKDVIKEVEVYALNGNPSVTVQAKVEKKGVIRILAQSPGIVNTVYFTEGQEVLQGQLLAQMATNYQGGNAPAIQASIAQATYDNTKDTYDTQKEIIQKQREAADKMEANADELRKIASESAGDTQSLLDLNLSIYRSLESQLQELERNNASETAILALQSQISPIQSAVVQLQSQLRNFNYQKDGDKPAAQLGVLQRDITKKQLDIQEKALELSLKTSKLQADFAWVQASLMAPAAPCTGIVEKVFVKPGDSINPGDPIATIKTENNQATLEALVPSDIAFAVSQTASSSAVINNATVMMNPFYVSREATDGQLYSVFFSLPEDTTGTLSDGEYLAVTIPLNMVSMNSEPYVPLDAVYQTQDEAYVFVIRNNKAMSKKVTLGDVYGNFVLVKEGLLSNEEIILNRNVVAGETVRVMN